MYNVYQHWDPLRVCVVGRAYPPEFYSWVKVPHVRELFERIALETEEDFQAIIKKLKEFGVEILRPELPNQITESDKFVPPPLQPRDFGVMIGEIFYNYYGWSRPSLINEFYNDVKDPSWPPCDSLDDFKKLPQHIQDECVNIHDIYSYLTPQKKHDFGCYDKIFQKVESQGNQIKHGVDRRIVGAVVSRIGKDLYFGTEEYNLDNTEYLKTINREFPKNRNHIVDTGGHGDATYCPVCPGLIISLKDIPTYAETFPGWEVVYLPSQTWDGVKPFLDLRQKNYGKWWIPGFEYDHDVVDTVKSWLDHWTGYVEETVFDINMLIIDPKNVMVFNYNKQVFEALERHGITPHVVTFRHKHFWDAGIHCVTLDLHREGTVQDYFPERG